MRITFHPEGARFGHSPGNFRVSFNGGLNLVCGGTPLSGKNPKVGSAVSETPQKATLLQLSFGSPSLETMLLVVSR